jgi:hypothetical protein
VRGRLLVGGGGSDKCWCCCRRSDMKSAAMTVPWWRWNEISLSFGCACRWPSRAAATRAAVVAVVGGADDRAAQSLMMINTTQLGGYRLFVFPSPKIVRFDPSFDE